MTNEDQRKAGKKPVAILLKLLAVFVALQALVLVFPKAFPSLVTRALPAVAFLSDDDYTLMGTTLTRRNMGFEVKSLKLSHFHTMEGLPGPTVIFEGFHQNSAINIYPVMVLTVLFVLPGALIRKAWALGLGCLWVLLLGLFDCSVALHWLGAEFLQTSFAEARAILPGSPENLTVFKGFEKDIERLTLVKSFLSTGGRQFLSVLAVGMCLLLLLPFQRSVSAETEENQQDSGLRKR